MQYQLRIQGRHYEMLKRHLFPGDNKEAVAVLLCGRHETEQASFLLSYKIVLVPHSECERDEQYVRWNTARLLPFFEEVERRNLAIVKIHSHPTGYTKFSEVDDESDSTFFPAAFSWSETESVHASLVMLPDFSIFGRVYRRDMSISPISKIAIAGDEILQWTTENKRTNDQYALRTIQTFGSGTYQKLKGLKIAVIGCSGTGSPTIEQLVRLGVGTIVLVDPDLIELKNLNRILNSTYSDVDRPKVVVIGKAIKNIGLDTSVIQYNSNLFDSKEALIELISCDIIFGCVDSVDGRHLLSQLSSFYLIPYFDMGVKLIADGEGGISTIVGSVNYIQPGCSSLMSRGLYTAERLRSESTKRQDPEAYQELLKQKYIQGVQVDSPAVISINMLISSQAVVEFLNRLHPFKDEHAAKYARVMVDYRAGCIINEEEGDFDQDEQAVQWAGRGDCKPFLRMPELQM